MLAFFPQVPSRGTPMKLSWIETTFPWPVTSVFSIQVGRWCVVEARISPRHRWPLLRTTVVQKLSSTLLFTIVNRPVRLP